MSRRVLASYAALAALAAVGHAGYPSALWLLTRRRPDPVPPSPASWPPVTVLVPAYREAAVIAAKVRDCHANGYPGQLEVLVVADDADTAAAARAAGARVIENLQRQGKAAAVSGGFAAASGDVIVLTDANTTLMAGSLPRMVRWFSDARVGAVAGEKRHSHGAESAYWAFESWLKRRENRLGSTIGLVGECAAVRRATAPVLPGDVVVEDFWLALAILGRGARVVYEPSAVAIECPAGTAEEWERRTRIVSGALMMLLRHRDTWSLRRPLVAFQVWGHRLLRMTVAPVAHLVLLGLAIARAVPGGRGGRVDRLIVTGHAAAVVGLVGGDRAPAALRLAGQVLYLQAIAVGGLLRAARQDVAVAWPKPERVVA